MPLATRSSALVYNPGSHYLVTLISLDNQENVWGLIMSAQIPRCPRRCDPWSKLGVRILCQLVSHSLAALDVYY